MKLKTKLFATAFLSIGMLSTLAIGLFYFSYKVRVELDKASVADKFRESATSVNILAHEYTVLQTVRTERLLEQKLKELEETVKESKGRIPLDIISNACDSLNNAYYNLKSIYGERKELVQTEAYQDELERTIFLEDAMATLMFAESHRIMSMATRIAIEARSNSNELQRTGLFLVTVFSFVLIAVIGFSHFIIARGITGSLRRLKNSADIIGVGNLEKPVPVLGGDEFGDLAKAFEDMRIKRRQADKELNQHREHLEVLVAERTSDLSIAIRRAEEASSAKSQFLASMSHELRTPLNAILGYSQAMLRDRELNSSQKEKLDVITTSGGHLLGLINDVLEMTKIETMHTTFSASDFNLYKLLDILKSLFSNRAAEKGLKLKFQVSTSVPMFVNTDSQKLRQILSNLLSNALKFTNEGHIDLRASYEDQVLIVAIEDTGIGIQEDDFENIFRPFTQAEAGLASSEGSGLGLALCQRFVTTMGGSIQCASTLGKGSVFTIKIPAPPVDKLVESSHESEEQVVGLEPDQPDYRILIVEDHRDSRKLLEDLLKSVGFTVRVADDGEKAVFLAESWQPHLIWMDVGLPVMDGLAATRKIKANPEMAQTKIIALTAHAFEEDRDKVMTAGCDDFVRKPYQETDIFLTMERHLGVRYLYEEEQGSTTEGKIKIPEIETLAALPPDLLREMRGQVEILDPDAFTDVISRIEQHDPALASDLQGLIDNFRFDILSELISGV